MILKDFFSKLVSGSSTPLPSVGSAMPGFALKDAQGQVHQSKDYVGSWIVIYFYPKDRTPGCTAQACSFRDHYDFFVKKGVKIFGVSIDTEESHRDFAAKKQLPFPLLADVGATVSELFGVKGFLGFSKRITFIISPDQKIAAILSNVSTGTYAEAVQAELEKLGVK